MNFRHVLLKVNCGDIDLRLELLVCHRQDVRFSGLGLDSKVQVAGIVPSTHSNPGNGVQRSIRRKSGFLVVPVDPVLGKSHQGIVHVTGVVPYSVLFIHTHMTHLVWQEIFDYGLPDTSVIHIFTYSEY